MKLKFTNFTFYIILVSFCLFNIACDSEDIKKEDDGLFNYSMTFGANEKGVKFEINGTLTQGTVGVANTVEKNRLTLTMRTATAELGAINWLPLETGTFNSGDNMGVGVGSAGQEIRITAYIIVNGVKYYAYSSHVYGFQEDKIIPNSSCTIKITKYDGKYVDYRQSFGSTTLTLNAWLGTLEGLFVGTFINENGDKIEITKGEFRIIEVLPDNAEIIGD